MGIVKADRNDLMQAWRGCMENAPSLQYLFLICFVWALRISTLTSPLFRSPIPLRRGSLVSIHSLVSVDCLGSQLLLGSIPSLGLLLSQGSLFLLGSLSVTCFGSSTIFGSFTGFHSFHSFVVSLVSLVWGYWHALVYNMGTNSLKILVGLVRLSETGGQLWSGGSKHWLFARLSLDHRLHVYPHTQIPSLTFISEKIRELFRYCFWGFLAVSKHTIREAVV